MGIARPLFPPAGLESGPSEAVAAYAGIVSRSYAPFFAGPAVLRDHPSKAMVGGASTNWSILVTDRPLLRICPASRITQIAYFRFGADAFAPQGRGIHKKRGCCLRKGSIERRATTSASVLQRHRP